MFVKLAWRNIWRNPRRTTVILIAVVIGVWSMVFLGALMRGMMDQMVRTGIATLTGEIQIHLEGYRSDPVIENSMHNPTEIEDALGRTLPPGSRWASRVRVGAVANNARHSGGVTLVGIEPERERALSFIGSAVEQGRFLRAGDTNGIIVGRALLDKFETRLGRKLVIMSQDTAREIASRAFRIIGVFRAEMEATEEAFVFVTKPAAQRMLQMPSGISEVSIILPDRKAVEGVARAIQGALPPPYEVETWKELLPLISAYLAMMDGWIFIWYVVVFIAMGFGIANTMLMAVFERIKEFGLLKSFGMKPRGIVTSVLTESLMLLFVGIIVGSALGISSVWMISQRGIDLSALAAGAEYAGISKIIRPTLYLQDIISADLVVLLLGLLVSLYPAVKAARFTPVEALAHH